MKHKILELPAAFIALVFVYRHGWFFPGHYSSSWNFPFPGFVYRSQESPMGFFQDLRFGVRMLGKRPGFTLIAVATIALGVSVNSVVFTIVNAVLINGLPF